MTITLAGGERVLAQHDGLTIVTDQDGSAPSPFALFLASIGTCAGYYIASYCAARGLPLEGIRLNQKGRRDASGKLFERIEIDVDVPPSFPAEHRAGLLRAARFCTVKKHLEQPPTIEVRVAGA